MDKGRRRRRVRRPAGSPPVASTDVGSTPGLAWQATLFGDGEPAPDVRFTTLARTELDRGAWVDHAPGWLRGADVLFAHLLEEVPWGARQRWMYDRRVVEPRLTAWWSLDGDDAVPHPVRAAAAALRSRYQVRFDSVGCNLYRDGRDSVAWHGDRVARSQAQPLVAIVSLGSTRRFLLRPADSGRGRRYDLHTGDLLVMGGTCQHTWQHSVPKAAAAGPRVSVTFRHTESPAPTSVRSGS